MPAEAIASLHFYLKNDTVGAVKAFAIAKQKLDPRLEGTWKKYDALLAGRKPENLMPVSPDDWLAILLR